MTAMFGLFEKDPGPAIERLEADRAADCATLHAAAFHHPWPEPDFEALLLARATYATAALGRAMPGKTGELQGFILSRLAADEAEVLTIAVQPRRRGLGIAGRLMEANMADLRAGGAKSWFLEVEVGNAPALALYERFGFAKVGERASYYRTSEGASAHALILKRDLR